MNNLQTEAFWTFSLAFYSVDKVKQACLALQDDFSLNVNLILLCAYADSINIGLTVEQLNVLQAGILALDKQTAEHRSERRRLSKGSDEYKLALQRELELEKQQQQRLIELTTSMTLVSGTPSLDNLIRLVEPTQAHQRIQTLKQAGIQFKDLSRR